MGFLLVSLSTKLAARRLLFGSFARDTHHDDLVELTRCWGTLHDRLDSAKSFVKLVITKGSVFKKLFIEILPLVHLEGGQS